MAERVWEKVKQRGRNDIYCSDQQVDDEAFASRICSVWVAAQWTCDVWLEQWWRDDIDRRIWSDDENRFLLNKTRRTKVWSNSSIESFTTILIRDTSTGCVSNHQSFSITEDDVAMFERDPWTIMAFQAHGRVLDGEGHSASLATLFLLFVLVIYPSFSIARGRQPLFFTFTALFSLCSADKDAHSITARRLR